METYIKKKKHNYKFKELADLVLNHTVLKVATKYFRIVEIEFYLRSPNHKDPYTYERLDQTGYGQWYFHKVGKTSDTYREDTRKGLDLYLADTKSNIYFGILIRSIYDIENGTLIEGPSKSVDAILSAYKVRSVATFVRENKKIKILDHDFEADTIYRGPRIGMSDKCPLYRDKKYRYLIMKNMIKKKKAELTEVK